MTIRTCDDDPARLAADPEFVLRRRPLRWAEQGPERPYLTEVGGSRLSFGQTVDRLERWTAVLAAHGVGGMPIRRGPTPRPGRRSC